MDGIKHTGNAFHNIIDIGEIADHVAVVEYLDGLVVEDGFGEKKQSHVGTAPGTVNGEEAQAGGGKAEQVAVSMGHQFVAFLCGGIQTDGMVDIICRAEWHFGVAAVHARGAGIHQVLYFVMPAGFQYV